jgi:hypothetical protein
LEDQPWFPQWMRRQQMEFIGFVVSAFGLYKPVIPLLTDMLQNADSQHITDSCSGSGGPMLYLAKRLPTHARITLTDLYPQAIAQLPNNVQYHNAPLNLLTEALPNSGIVTMCNAFHHFSPAAQTGFLKKMAYQHRPVLVVEILRPNLLCALKILFTTTIGQFLLAPFVKPFSPKRLLFTYIIPLNLFTITWDGLASVAKSASFAYLQKLAKACSTTSYQFTCYRLGSLLSPLYVVHGAPIKS